MRAGWKGIEAELAHHDHEVREGECTGEIKRPKFNALECEADCIKSGNALSPREQELNNP